MKSLDELKEIREKAIKRLDIRRLGENDDIKIMVGMGTCGIAAGARETLRSIIDSINEHDLKNVYAVQVGCMGQCHAEPLVQVNIPGKKPVLYGKVTAERVNEIVNNHVINGQVVEGLVIEGSLHEN